MGAVCSALPVGGVGRGVLTESSSCLAAPASAVPDVTVIPKAFETSTVSLPEDANSPKLLTFPIKLSPKDAASGLERICKCGCSGHNTVTVLGSENVNVPCLVLISRTSANDRGMCLVPPFAASVAVAGVEALMSKKL